MQEGDNSTMLQKCLAEGQALQAATSALSQSKQQALAARARVESLAEGFPPLVECGLDYVAKGHFIYAVNPILSTLQH